MGARPSIDHNQVCLMIGTGFSDCLIAKRLHISRKQVQRIRQQNNINRNGINVDLGTPQEYRWWFFYFRTIDKSMIKTAYRFGVTRQRVFQILQTRGGLND